MPVNLYRREAGTPGEKVTAEPDDNPSASREAAKTESQNGAAIRHLPQKPTVAPSAPSGDAEPASRFAGRRVTARERYCRKTRIRVIRNGRLDYIVVRCGKPWCPECRDDVLKAWDTHLSWVWADIARLSVASFVQSAGKVSDDPTWVCLSGRIRDRGARYLRFPFDDGRHYVFADQNLRTVHDETSFVSYRNHEAKTLFLDLLKQKPPQPVMASKPRGSKCWEMKEEKKPSTSRRIFYGVAPEDEERVQERAEALILERYGREVDLSLNGEAPGLDDAVVVAIVDEARQQVEGENPAGEWDLASGQ